ncbi:hypothetical protein RUM43_013828 [Polyplax serrata]|uniref:Protein SDA1 n=1 Tax=Polyplax serrata TaxID=468196 RepID=A0AAN8P1I9_POLSC
MVRRNNQLPHNLPQLRNLIKKDPASYKDDFELQYAHFKSMLELFHLQPDRLIKNLDDLVMFIAQVSHCYPEQLSEFPQMIINLLECHHMVLHPEMRFAFCRCLIVLRNKNLLEPTDLLSLFFNLLRCQDRALRKFLEIHIITDIKNINAKHKNVKLNTVLQNFMFGMLKDSNSKAAKMSLGVMIELYKKKIWNDAKTVNVISVACFSKIVKVMVAALKFFLGSDKQEENDKSDSSDSENEVNPKEVIMANKVNKKTRKRLKQLEKVKKLVKKNKNKKEKAPSFNFSALHLIHDPQGFAEKLFKRLEFMNQRFEVKIMMLDVISRLIGLHQLMLLNFYPYIQRYLQPHQREVTKMLLFVAQASHDLIPPEIIEPILQTLMNNFVTERNSSDVMAIGLNAIREVCTRCPLAMNKELLVDLTGFKTYKDRSVMMAAKSLIHLYRTSMPSLLHKKDRGKLTESAVSFKMNSFGDINPLDHVPGAEVLALENQMDSSGASNANSDSDSDWIDVPQSDDEDIDTGKETCEEVVQRKTELAVESSLSRIMTDEDFKKIDTAQLRKQVLGVGRGKKRSLEVSEERGELLNLKDIENIYKKRKHNKEERIQSVRAGQEGKEKYGFKDRRQNPLCSKTNREKKKTKAYSMIKHKVRGKVKRSFKDKQIALRNHLIKQKRMK